MNSKPLVYQDLGESMDEFFAQDYALAWTTVEHRDGSTHRALCIRHPDLMVNNHSHLLVYTSHANDNWAQPGPVPGWDGDIEEPTLYPSIMSGKFHEYIVRGEFTFDVPPDLVHKIKARGA